MLFSSDLFLGFLPLREIHPRLRYLAPLGRVSISLPDLGGAKIDQAGKSDRPWMPGPPIETDGRAGGLDRCFKVQSKAAV